MANCPSVQPADRAATYVRMSTEHQQYSTENQATSLEAYAAERNFSIVRKFVDSGKSGLTLSSRLALRALLKEVESGTADFDNILVYDVSRWGRFQDADESAFTNTYASEPASWFIIVRSSSPTTVASRLPFSRL